jgi:hypothetical protein
MIRLCGLLLGALALLLCACAHVAKAPAIPPANTRAALLPARVRSLSNSELQRSVSALLGQDVDLSQGLPPDVRQSGYTRNAAQAWTGARAQRWASLVDELSAKAVSERASALWPCTGNDSPACTRDALQRVGQQAWRRPLAAKELDTLGRVFHATVADGQAAAIAAVYSALLQAPSFVYSSELGTPVASDAGVRQLNAYELASALSFTLRGTPPDALLLEQARTGALANPEVREAEAWRLLSQSDTRHQFRQFVLEWLEVDRLLETAKDQDTYPDYERLKSKLVEETANYADEVFVHHGASVRALLDAGFASVDPSVARYYGLQAYGPAVPFTTQPRRGVLQHASVLSAHAHPDISSPVKRGDFILRRILCTDLPRPAELGIEVVMPPPKPDETGRQRILAHTVNPGCASCHTTIDPLGFAFEGFDAAGHERTLDAAKPVDTAVQWTFQGQKHGFADSVELSRWLSRRAETQTCFSRQAFRFFSAQTSNPSEEAFIALGRTLPAAQRENLVALLVAYVKSDLFSWRRVEP